MREAMKKLTNWDEIATYVGTRDKNQCRSKWKQIKSPKKGAREWTDDEHSRMMILFDTMPNRWREIADVVEQT